MIKIFLTAPKSSIRSFLRYLKGAMLLMFEFWKMRISILPSSPSNHVELRLGSNVGFPLKSRTFRFVPLNILGAINGMSV